MSQKQFLPSVPLNGRLSSPCLATDYSSNTVLVVKMGSTQKQLRLSADNYQQQFRQFVAQNRLSITEALQLKIVIEKVLKQKAYLLKKQLQQREKRSKIQQQGTWRSSLQYQQPNNSNLSNDNNQVDSTMQQKVPTHKHINSSPDLNINHPVQNPLKINHKKTQSCQFGIQVQLPMQVPVPKQQVRYETQSQPKPYASPSLPADRQLAGNSNQNDLCNQKQDEKTCRDQVVPVMMKLPTITQIPAMNAKTNQIILQGNEMASPKIFNPNQGNKQILNNMANSFHSFQQQPDAYRPSKENALDQLSFEQFVIANSPRFNNESAIHEEAHEGDKNVNGELIKQMEQLKLQALLSQDQIQPRKTPQMMKAQSKHNYQPIEETARKQQQIGNANNQTQHKPNYMANEQNSNVIFGHINTNFPLQQQYDGIKKIVLLENFIKTHNQIEQNNHHQQQAKYSNKQKGKEKTKNKQTNSPNKKPKIIKKHQDQHSYSSQSQHLASRSPLRAKSPHIPLATPPICRRLYETPTVSSKSKHLQQINLKQQKQYSQFRLHLLNVKARVNANRNYMHGFQDLSNKSTTSSRAKHEPQPNLTLLKQEKQYDISFSQHIKQKQKQKQKIKQNKQDNFQPKGSHCQSKLIREQQLKQIKQRQKKQEIIKERMKKQKIQKAKQMEQQKDKHGDDEDGSCSPATGNKQKSKSIGKSRVCAGCADDYYHIKNNQRYQLSNDSKSKSKSKNKSKDKIKHQIDSNNNKIKNVVNKKIVSDLLFEVEKQFRQQIKRL